MKLLEKKMLISHSPLPLVLYALALTRFLHNSRNSACHACRQQRGVQEG